MVEEQKRNQLFKLSWKKLQQITGKLVGVAAVIVASPLKLPRVVKSVAQYVVLLGGIVSVKKEKQAEDEQ